MTKCILCDSEKIYVTKDNLIYCFDCEKCGKYKFSDPFLKRLPLSELERDAVKWFLGFNNNVFISDNDDAAVPIDYRIQEYKKYKQI